MSTWAQLHSSTPGRRRLSCFIRIVHKDKHVTFVQSATGVVHLRGQRLSSARSDRPPGTRWSQSDWTWRSDWTARAKCRCVWNGSHGSHGPHGSGWDHRSHWSSRAHRSHWNCWVCLWKCTHRSHWHHGSQRPHWSDGSHRSDGTHGNSRAPGTHCADRSRGATGSHRSDGSNGCNGADRCARGSRSVWRDRTHGCHRS